VGRGEILVINSGSSGIRFAAFGSDAVERAWSASVEGVALQE
jgi:acetate kinase